MIAGARHAWLIVNAAMMLIACSTPFTHEVRAAVPVEESTGTTVRGTGAAPPVTTTSPSSSTVRTYPAVGAATVPATPPRTGGGNAELFYQIQLLQNEVKELRGLIEEQAHQISRLEASQKEQYMDVDRRLAALAGVAGGERPASPTDGTMTITGPPTNAGGGTGNEQNDYTAAYNLIASNRPTEGIEAMTRFLRNYPDSKYAGNAYYWLGEGYLALPDADLERARQSFMQVQTGYPTHAKVPDAIFKTGVVYHMLGDVPKAMEHFDKVQREFPGSAAAQLAKSYAAELR
jgi:tol-pal system protein YbgF